MSRKSIRIVAILIAAFFLVGTILMALPLFGFGY